ncbi:hypothetical protein [Amycolatopsis ultiminotia]|uniref:hypothetical protein n=1 Tax=Amycolatopsis ultiminotia TaxID=543629 RepID=UPI0031ECB300
MVDDPGNPRWRGAEAVVADGGDDAVDGAAPEVIATATGGVLATVDRYASSFPVVAPERDSSDGSMVLWCSTEVGAGMV